MALTVINNVASLSAQNALNATSNSLNTSLERLSTGLQINTGADGPAALVISENQRAQIAGLTAAISNTSKAINLIQTADGALTEVSTLLTKIRSLAVDSANTSVQDSNSLAANQAEITNALATINDIASNTQFGTKHLLDGSAGYQATSTASTLITNLSATSATTAGTYSLTGTAAVKGSVTLGNAFSTGAVVLLSNAQNVVTNETLTINNASSGTASVTLTAGETNVQAAAAINVYTSQTGVVADTGGTGGSLRFSSKVYGQNFTVTSSAGSGGAAAPTTGATGFSTYGTTGFITGTTTVDTHDTAGATTTGVNAAITLGSSTAPGGAALTGSTYTVNGNVIAFTSGPAKGLTFTIPDSATAFTSATLSSTPVNVTNNSLTFQIGANAGQTSTFAIGNSSASTLGLNVAGVQFGNLGAIDVTQPNGGADSIKVVDQAINDVTTLRGNLGAFQANTLEGISSSLQATLTNTTAAESTIRDTNYAAEISNYTKTQVQLQAGVSVLASSNQLPQAILTLLKG